MTRNARRACSPPRQIQNPVADNSDNTNRNLKNACGVVNRVSAISPNATANLRSIFERGEKQYASRRIVQRSASKYSNRLVF
jgi:hypothetical protein